MWNKYWTTPYEVVEVVLGTVVEEVEFDEVDVDDDILSNERLVVDNSSSNKSLFS